jgi:hypothetical protein
VSDVRDQREVKREERDHREADPDRRDHRKAGTVGRCHNKAGPQGCDHREAAGQERWDLREVGPDMMEEIIRKLGYRDRIIVNIGLRERYSLRNT